MSQSTGPRIPGALSILDKDSKEDVMTFFDDTLRCDGCGVEILAAPVVVDGYHYCCRDCAEGYECSCVPEIEELDLQ